MQSISVAVAFGGVSNENEISVITGIMAVNVLKKKGISVLPVYQAQSGEIYAGGELADIALFKGEKYKGASPALFARGGVWLCNGRGKPKKFYAVDCLLNCCHGGWGEGGGISGLCGVYGIPLASAGVFESAAFMNKYYTKLVLRSLNVKTAPYALVRSSGDIPAAIEKIGFPMIVKPLNLGSSIGVVKTENAEELEEAVLSALCLDEGAICEKYYADRREINCAAYAGAGGIVTSECEEAAGPGDVYSYEDKYQGGGKSVYPADIPPSIAGVIKKTTEKVYSSLQMRGIVRFDYILSGTAVILSEINTVPGSLSYYLLSGGFADFGGVLLDVIERAKADCAQNKKRCLIKTGILNNFNANACKMK